MPCVQRIWSYKEKIFDKKRSKKNGQDDVAYSDAYVAQSGETREQEELSKKRLRKRSRSKEMCEFSEEKEEKEIKIRRNIKAESADLDSVDEADL